MSVRLHTTCARSCQRAAQAPPSGRASRPRAGAHKQSRRSTAREGGRQPPRPLVPAPAPPPTGWGGGKGKTGWALARGTAPRRASLGAYTGPPGLTLCSHGPHRRLMTCNTGPADGAAGPRGGPHPFRQHAPPGPRIPAPGPTRPQPGRASLTPVPQLLVYERQGSSAHQLSPQTTTCAWVHPCRSRLPTSHAASAAASSPRPALSFPCPVGGPTFS